MCHICHTPLLQMVTDYDLPLIEMGFSSTAELLQRVPGIEMVRPPNTNSMMVFSTWCSADKEKEADKKVTLLLLLHLNV